MKWDGRSRRKGQPTRSSYEAAPLRARSRRPEAANFWTPLSFPLVGAPSLACGNSQTAPLSCPSGLRCRRGNSNMCMKPSAIRRTASMTTLRRRLVIADAWRAADLRVLPPAGHAGRHEYRGAGGVRWTPRFAKLNLSRFEHRINKLKFSGFGKPESGEPSDGPSSLRPRPSSRPAPRTRHHAERSRARCRCG